MNTIDNQINQWLKSVKGIGNRFILSLRDKIDSEKLVTITFDELSGIIKNDKVARAIIQSRDLKKTKEYMEISFRKEIDLIDYMDKEYPDNLKEIYDFPIEIHIKGKKELLNNRMVAIVGTRRPTEEGRKIARDIGKVLAKGNITVVSGMAGGIDSEAHRGALEGKGSTIAVLGSGVDVCYPAYNKSLYEDILKKGLILSEYNNGTKPLSYNFPRRNRIISGLCDSIIVIEAGISSGTLITVQQGLEQGKNIYAVPGSIFSSKSDGTNYLIKEGATPICSIKDIEAYFGISNKEEEMNLNNVQIEIYDYIKINQPVHISEFSIDLNITGDIISKELMTLQLMGVISKLPGNKFITY